MLSALRVSDHPAATWANAAEPWLRANGAAWRERRAVLAPNAAWIAALKAGAITAGLPILGVNWLTPGRWRALALRALPGPARQVALREDLHLLLELAAAGLPDNLLARAYGPDPAPFQELLDALDGSGWDGEVFTDAAARELAAAAARMRAQVGWLTTAAADRALRDAAANGSLPRLGEKLLAVGFSPADWALRPLLETAAAAHDESEFVLDVVDYEQTIAAAWVGAWEEAFGGPAEWLEAADAPAPFARLAAEILAPARPAPAQSLSAPENAPPVLWLADNLQAEADLAVAQALAFLGEAGDRPARVGVVVGSVNSPLAREVAARFAALDLPYHDAPGHLPGRAPAQAWFEAWLDWQRDGRLAGLVSWVRTAARGGLLNEKNAGRIEKNLREAARATLTDDPTVLEAWLAGARSEAVAAREFLAAWPRLPESAPGEDFLKAILEVSQKIRWPEEPEFLQQRLDNWRGAVTTPLPRAAVLRWVRAVTRVPGRTRDAQGREPWALLQIVDAASAAAQEWTHLVLGGLLHGEWPADDRDSPLLSEARVRELNRAVLRQGAQGEGHWTAVPGHTPLLSQADRRRLDRAVFARLLGLPTKGLALTARLADPADGRPARLSEYFWAAAKLALGRLPTQDDWAALAAASRARHEVVRAGLGGSLSETVRRDLGKIPAPSPVATARAHAARRNPQTAFDEFSFCLPAPPTEPLKLSCKKWQEALARPGAAWFQHILRAEPRWAPAEDDPARLSLGSWAHEIARPGPANFAGGSATESLPRLSLALWHKLADASAQKIRAEAAAAFAAAQRPLPEAWLDTWARAARVAGQWVDALAENPEWTHALGETSLPSGLQGALPGTGVALSLSGRMDLVLFRQPVVFAPGQLGGTAAWVIDFKTGGDAPLSLKKLAEGAGLQVALYARALLALGAGAVSLTVLNAGGDAEPQLTGADLADPKLADLWRLLADFAQGRWGEHCDLDDEQENSGDYPSATLPVPIEILRRKWEITHPQTA
jgi:hypothetical protein